MLRKAAIALLLLPGLYTRSQPFPQLRFAQLTEKDGLSCNRATSVTQDADGLIWIGTNNGLNRFDGYGCTRFFANPDDSSTLPANEITNAVTGRDHSVWLMTTGGLCRFNSTTHKVDIFRSAISTPSVFRRYEGAEIWLDEKGEAFITSSSGLYHFTDQAHYSIMEEGLTPFVSRERSYSYYSKITSDKTGGLWSFAQNMIFQLDRQTKKVIRSFTLQQTIGVTALLFDHHNRCWVSTWHSGLLRFNPADGKCLRPDSQPPDLAGQAPRFASRVPRMDYVGGGVEWTVNGRSFLVFPTNDPGILLVDEETGRNQLYLHTAGLGIPNAPYVDRQNILWLPTNKGVFYLNSAGNLWDVLPLNIGGNPDASDPATPYVMREEKSGYWIGRRYEGGMLWYDRNWQLIRGWKQVVDPILHPMKENAATMKEAYDFKQTGEEMFITTEWGIVILNLKTLTRTLVRDSATSPIMRLRTIVPKDTHSWWIRSFDQGIFVFDPAARRFTRHYLLPGECPDCGIPQANYLYRDHRGNIFVSTNSGLFGYDAKTDQFVSLRPQGRPGLGNSLFGMAEDRSGLIWIGLDHGICAYDPDQGKVVRTLSENNTIGSVYRVTIDSAQNIWFASPAGYWCWLRRQEKTILFRLGEGLPDNNESLFYTTSNGNVYAGCTGALVLFHTDRIKGYNVTGKTKILDVLVNGSFVVPSSGPARAQLTLAPDENNLQIDFDVINYDIPANNLYFYRLEPGRGNWIQLDNGRLSFDDLPAGEYKLTVRGGNKLTGNYTPSDQLIFVIHPYWWLSWWFKGIVGLVLLLLVGVLVRIRIGQIRRESAFRQKMADTEMQALRAQMNPHFLFNSLNSIENFIMKNEKRQASDYLGKFARLIRMILSSSRNELVLFSKDMEALQLYVDLEQLRFNRKFTYQTEIDPQVVQGDYRLPSLLIQPYLENAIIHGIGLSSGKGLYVCVKAFLNDQHIHFIILDNGVGRRRSAEINQQNRPNHKSVGLSITADRIHIFSHQQRSAGSVRIRDLYDEDGAAAGTEVEVIIKAV